MGPLVDSSYAGKNFNVINKFVALFIFADIDA